MDPLLAKAEPIRNGDSTSVITYLRRGKKHCVMAILQPERGVSRCERNNSAHTKVREEGGGGDAPGAGAEIPCSPWRRPLWGRLSLCSPWRSMVEQISTCSSWRTPCQSRWMPEGGCDPVESPYQSRFAGRTCDPVGDPHWSTLFRKDCTPCKDPMLEQFMKNCSPWEDPMLEKCVENCLLWEGPHTGAE